MLKSIFSAIGRVAASLNRTADLIDECNGELIRRLAFESVPEVPVVPEARRLPRKAVQS